MSVPPRKIFEQITASRSHGFKIDFWKGFEDFVMDLKVCKVYVSSLDDAKILEIDLCTGGV